MRVEPSVTRSWLACCSSVEIFTLADTCSTLVRVISICSTAFLPAVPPWVCVSFCPKSPNGTSRKVSSGAPSTHLRIFAIPNRKLAVIYTTPTHRLRWRRPVSGSPTKGRDSLSSSPFPESAEQPWHHSPSRLPSRCTVSTSSLSTLPSSSFCLELRRLALW